MLNVLHLVNHLGRGGSEKYICLLAKKLHDRLCRFYLAYSEEGGGRELFEEAGIDLARLIMRNPFDIRAAAGLKALCARLSIDVVHTHFLRENYIAVLSKILGNKVKIINTRHMLFENTRRVIAANRFFTRFDDKIIAVSNSVKDQLISEGIDPGRVELIYTGIDPEEWSIPVTPTFRKEHGISADEILVTSIARFSEEKGHDFFIDAIGYFKEHMEELGAASCKFRFILAGDGELCDKIIKKAEALGLQNDIIFTGYIGDIKNLLKSSDIFISHSRSESFGISILEAMAAGIPVISTDSGGAAEIVNSRFENGILINYGDKKALAESLAELARKRELRKLYAENGLKIVREHFCLDKTAEETYNLYKQ
jgi:glycosyltransferase involved in cell wall biosynthesis